MNRALGQPRSLGRAHAQLGASSFNPGPLPPAPGGGEKGRVRGGCRGRRRRPRQPKEAIPCAWGEVRRKRIGDGRMLARSAPKRK